MAYDFEEVQNYAEANTTPPLDALRRLGEETEATQSAPEMSVGPNSVRDAKADLVFIDAWKPDYVEYYELVLPKLAPDGLVLADNTLSALEDNEGIARFNEHVLADDRVESVLVPIRDGVTLIRKR